MCGRFSMAGSLTALIEAFLLPAPPQVVDRFNVAPTDEILAICTTPKGTTRWDRLCWGLVPAWAKDPAVGARMINARAETVAGKPAFRRAFAERRCLLPATGFFEWQIVGRSKQPWFFRMRTGALFCFAGLWERWESPAGDERRTCTLLTTSPNEVVKPVHDRMPVLLGFDEGRQWLNPEADAAALMVLLRPYPADRMECHPVSRRVNRPGEEGPDLIDPLFSDRLPGLAAGD